MLIIPRASTCLIYKLIDDLARLRRTSLIYYYAQRLIRAEFGDVSGFPGGDEARVNANKQRITLLIRHSKPVQTESGVC